MNQKGFVNIFLIVIIVALVGVGTYFVLNRSTQPPFIPTPTPAPGTPTPGPGPITVVGETTCLPKKGSGPHTLECAIGLKRTDGLHYGLKYLSQQDPEHRFSITGTGTRVEISGIFSPEEMSGPGGSKYDVVGTIDVTFIKEIRD